MDSQGVVQMAVAQAGCESAASGSLPDTQVSPGALIPQDSTWLSLRPLQLLLKYDESTTEPYPSEKR